MTGLRRFERSAERERLQAVIAGHERGLREVVAYQLQLVEAEVAALLALEDDLEALDVCLDTFGDEKRRITSALSRAKQGVPAFEGNRRENVGVHGPGAVQDRASISSDPGPAAAGEPSSPPSRPTSLAWPAQEASPAGLGQGSDRVDDPRRHPASEGVPHRPSRRVRSRRTSSYRPPLVLFPLHDPDEDPALFRPRLLPDGVVEVDTLKEAAELFGLEYDPAMESDDPPP